MARAWLAAENRSHGVEFLGIDGRARQHRNDFDSIVGPLDDLGVADRIFGASSFSTSSSRKAGICSMSAVTRTS
jgi:hypothetical protein